jgi:hypothetical protein
VADGFGVVGDALIDAADGVAAATAGLSTRKIADIEPSADHVGHPFLKAALTDFTDRWEIGVTHLLHDGEQFATRLQDTATAYLGVDEQIASVFRRMNG